MKQVSYAKMRLQAENLACRREGRLIFSGLSFGLSNGEAIALTGRNGAGKSSLIAMLCGRLRAAEGSITFAAGSGEADEEATPLVEASHHVGHRDALKTALTAGENLSFARAMLGEPALEPAEALASVGLTHVAALPVGLLSAGQRRRVALARLLVSRRPLWLLDEPMAALDAASQAMLAGLMEAHLAQGGAILAATHGPLGLAAARELRIGP